MIAFPIVLALIASVTAVVWGSRHFLISREHRDGFVLGEKYTIEADKLPPVSVVVAAKDEQDNIETCIRSMLSQDYGDFEMVVCNDRSTDKTQQIVESILLEDKRLSLINITELPDGWCGKNNAMQHGVAAAKHDWICMIDADCKQTSQLSLAAAVQYAIDNQADLLSVLPEMEMETTWEKIVQPVCSGVMMIWFLPEKVNNPNKSNAYANGAFMLIKRQAYDAVGQHEAIKGCINEDMHMAHKIKSSGLNLRVVRNHNLYSVRMYETLGQMLNGWTRIFYGTFSTFRRLRVSLIVLVTMGLVPWLAAGLGLGLAGSSGGASWAWWACGIAGATSALMQLTVCGRFYKLLGSRVYFGWLYPLGCVMAMIAVIRAMLMYRDGAKLIWRDTAYSRPD